MSLTITWYSIIIFEVLVHNCVLSNIDVHADNNYFGTKFTREKVRDLTQSFDKRIYTRRKIPKHDNTKTPPITSIIQRLRTAL